MDKSPTHLREVAGLFLRLGFTAFGGPAAHIAFMRDEVVRKRGWVTDEQFVDLMGVANLIPGPTSTELAIYLGYLRAGWQGLIVAGICFIFPAMAMVLILAALYVQYGTLPQVTWLFYGIQPIVVAIILQALWNLRRAALKTTPLVVLMIIVLILYFLGVNVLVLLLGSGILAAAWRWSRDRLKAKEHLAAMLPFLKSHLTIAGTAAGATATVSLLTLFLTFLKYGAVIYGSGYVLLAFLRTDLVQNLGWLTDRQLLDAITIGQVTPGPVFTTATFIGYVISGLPGALLATLGIFLPSFALIALVHPIAARLRTFPPTAALLDAVNAAAFGLMLGVLIQIAQVALVDPLTWLVAILALIALLRFKVNSTWLIAAGILIGLARAVVH